MRKIFIYSLFISSNIFIVISLFAQGERIFYCRAGGTIYIPMKVTKNDKFNTIYARKSFDSTRLLYAVNGVISDASFLQKLNPDDIVSINIFKDIKGVFWCNRPAYDAVIIITTKHNQDRKFIIKDFLDGSRISGATVSFISFNIQDTFMAAANDSGVVVTDKLKPGDDYQIKVSAVGYKDLIMSFKNNSVNKENNIQMERDIKNCKEVVISNYSTIRCRLPICCGYIISSGINKKDILNNEMILFSIFPNPVQSGTSINIECKQPEEGEYMLQLFNQAGQLTFNKEMWIDKDARVLNLELPHVAVGNYFLRMTNKHSGKAFTEKIIIQ